MIDVISSHNKKLSPVKMEAVRTAYIQNKINESTQRLSDLIISKASYEALTEYENRNYILDDGSEFDGAVKTTDYSYVFGANDLLVSTTGNDTTGDGSELNPFASWEKAILSSSTTLGGTIWIEGGTYSMNSGGLGYASIARNNTLPVIVKAKPNETVILTHTLSTQGVKLIGTNNNIFFEGLTFRPIANTDEFFYSQNATSTTNIEFRDCIFENVAGLEYAINFRGSGTNSDHRIKRCTFEDGAGDATCFFQSCTNVDYIGNIFTNNTNTIVRALWLNTNCLGNINVNNNTLNSTSMVTTVGNTNVMLQMEQKLIGDSTVNYKRNNITTTGKAIYTRGTPDLHNIELNIISNTVNASATISAVYTTLGITSGQVMYNTIDSQNLSLGLPEEGARLVGKEVTLEIAFNNITSGDHPLLLGENGLNCNVHDNISQGDVFGIIIKGDGHTFERNIYYGGTRTGLYYKNAENCVSFNDLILQRVAGGNAIEYGTGTAFSSRDNTIKGALVECTNGDVFETGTIGTGNIQDENKYYLSGLGSWGDVFNPVMSLQDVRDEWLANYPSAPNNDNKSVEV